MMRPNLDKIDQELNSAIDLMVRELEKFKKYDCKPKFSLERKSTDGRALDAYQLSLELENRSFTIIGFFNHNMFNPNKVNATINGEFCGLIDLTADNIVKHFFDPDGNDDEGSTDTESEFCDLVWEHFRKK